MKITLCLSFVILSGMLLSCKKELADSTNNIDPDNITHVQVNKEFILIKDVKKLSSSKDPISIHVDSIIKGLISTTFISTGQKSFDLNQDGQPDLSFEIIDLNKFNISKLPDTFDSLAAIVIPRTLEILDNSTYGYPDALNENDLISGKGHWSGKRSVLGTFLNVGQFNGKGERFLGFRLNGHYGWIKLSCSAHNDTLKIIEYAYNENPGKAIKAGQKK